MNDFINNKGSSRKRKYRRLKSDVFNQLFNVQKRLRLNQEPDKENETFRNENNYHFETVDEPKEFLENVELFSESQDVNSSQVIDIDIFNGSSDNESDEECEMNQLRNWAINENITYSSVGKLLIILKKKLLPELPSTAKTFLGLNYDYSIKHINKDTEYVYFGLTNSILRTVNPSLHKTNTILLQINVDGMSIYKSNNLQFWPILAKIFSEDDLYKPFVVGILLGNAKPHDAKPYLDEFIMDVNNLQSETLDINQRKFKVSIMCFICDNPARAFLKFCKGHGGYGACERCTDHGIRVDNRTIYPAIDAKERTNESFRAREDQDHHIGVSPLLQIRPEIDMVKSFVLDYMHLACNGIMLKLLWDYWITGKRQIRMKKVEVKELSRRLLCLKKYIPFEFQRQPRSAKIANKWKATELRLFLLYLGPIVLQKLLPTNLYKHFLLLHVAFRILCSDDFKTQNSRAKSYLIKFFQAAEILYGKQTLIMNMHNLLHVADDALNMNTNLSKISAFPFENYLGKLRKFVRTPNKPLAQVCRRLQERTQFENKIIKTPTPFTIYKSYSSEDCVIIKKLKIKNLFTITTKRPNNCIITKDNIVLLVTKIFFKEDNIIQITGKILKKKISIFKYPLKSSKLQIYEILKTKEKLTINADFIKNKLLLLSVNMSKNNPYNHYVIPFLH